MIYTIYKYIHTCIHIKNQKPMHYMQTLWITEDARKMKINVYVLITHDQSMFQKRMA